MKKAILWIGVTVIVIIIYHVCYGLDTLLPTNINWLMSARHDWGTHYLGWAFFKNEAWHFPLGKVTGYNYPVGTNVGFTDSIPLMAILFKLFAPFLSGDFQYFGIWLFLCHLLAAYFTILLFRLFKINLVISLAAAIFIAANPVLIHRGMHPALCAQWLLIACTYFYFLNPQITTPNKILLYQFVLLALSSLINPYLCAIVIGFTFATPVKLCFIDKVLSRKKFFIYLAISVLSVLLIWFITGMISFGKQEDLGIGGAYGLYTMNLNSLYNAGGWSALTHAFDWVSWHQYEGFMYVGAGILLLILILLLYYAFSFIRGRIKKSKSPEKAPLRNNRLIPLLVLVVLCAIFSISLVISFNSKVILRIPAPSIFVHLEEIFRACGRFFWLPYYLLILFTIIGIARMKMKPLVASSLIIAALAVQLYDIKLLLTFRNLPSGTYTPPMDNKNWLRLMNHFDEIMFFPAFESPRIRPMDYQDFSYLALKAGKPVNLAYVARGNFSAMHDYNDSQAMRVENGKLSPKALYITNAANLEHFSFALQSNKARLNILDSCYYLYANVPENEKINPLADQLNAPVKSILDSVLKALAIHTQFTETSKVPMLDNKSIHYWVQSLNIGERVISMEGFAFIDTTMNNKGDSIFVTLTAGDKSYIVSTHIKQRPDITAAFNKPYLEDSGFTFMAYSDNVPAGEYKMGLVIKDVRGRLVYQPIEKEIKIKNP